MSQITATNAYQFADNYTVYRGDDADFGFIGCEHNETEALAVAAYLEGRGGDRCWVRRNSKEDVRCAKTFRKDVVRANEHVREEAFRCFNLGCRSEMQPPKRHLVKSGK